MTFLLFIVSTLISFLVAKSTFISNWLTKWNSKFSAAEKELHKQKRALKQEQQQYSMIDDFAKYSKLQRKINAIDEQLEKCVNTKNPFWTVVLFNYGPKVVLSMVLLILTVYYRRTPLFKLPDFVDLSPFNNVISYPNERNFVSFHFWVMSCNVAARTIKIW
ncbi:guided entry of tail-anchored proteins factor 1-like [Anthonomus grandis grandis]|uniref:guided entry of tail-anchored proteins factor 1-like n=1 Tax=Anthonomus grandis grandis TaxID=2921223 RepID=UPI0021665375|nr:guided entry of tail-anchored proteins factor 1-like [Anthonomus grandis grandis]